MQRLFIKEKYQAIIYLFGFFLIVMFSVLMGGASHGEAKQVQSQPMINKINKVKKSKQIFPKIRKKPQPINRNYNIKKVGSAIAVTGAKLNKKLKGNLKGLGSEFVKAGNENHIDPVFLAALAVQETGWGHSEISDPPINNVGGITCMPKKYEEVFGASYPNPGCSQIVTGGTKWQKFRSIKDSIHFKAVYLKRSYVDQGRDTIGEIQKKYAPHHANNDKNGLNNYWDINIVEIMKNIKKNVNI